MAHAANESATEVSSYMTAIRNNFADGSKELEYYGDVITSLGASTAASSAEIAQGLEKFAAVGETIGLSYEYATSAVATVVDKTR
jgi:TP901 family phage tail tape measure protein